MQRRRFLCWSGVTAGAACLGSSKAFHGVPAAPGPPQAVAARARALGTTVTLTAIHSDARVAQRALKEAFEAMEEVERTMSLYRPDSQLSRLNRDGELREPHPDLVAVLRSAAAMSRRSGGAFDVTVQPLWSLFQAAQQRGAAPTRLQVAAARRLVDWRRVEVAADRIVLRDGAQITLNGIAQGFAADRARAALLRGGVTASLIDAGELGASGRNRDGLPWQVGIQHPRDPEAYAALAELADRCLATSGDYATRFGDGYASHHLWDPRTGGCPGEWASVSVAAPTAELADSLSTAVFVLGRQDGLALIRETSGADALWIDKQGQQTATAGFPRRALGSADSDTVEGPRTS